MKTSKKSSEKRQPLVVLARLLMPHLSVVASLLGFRPRAKEVEVDGIKTDAFVLPATQGGHRVDALLKHVLNLIGPCGSVPASGDGSSLELLLPLYGELTVSGTEVFEEKEEQDKAHAALIAYKPQLELLSRVLGRRVELHLGVNENSCAPYDPEDGVVHVLTGFNSPGEHETDYVREVFDLPLETAGPWILVRKPTRGRGFFLCDPKDRPIIQIIGTSVYVLVPVVSFFRRPVSVLIFQKIVGLIGTGLRDEARGTREAFPETTAVASIAKMVDGNTSSSNHWREQMKKNDRELEELQKELLGKYRLRAELVDLIRTFDDRIAKNSGARIKGDLRRIKDNPLVRRVYACDGGVQADSHPIHVRHDGKIYRLGTVVVRIGVRGYISIWSRESGHPNGIVHPHQNRDGTFCFGTATEAIIRAGAEMRLADAFELVLRWLRDGYEPHLALHPITEWPLVPTEEGGVS